eukprot:Sspe_Gene.17572::Locus_6242_Transcript_2_2_Confidence_0.750_Length_2592::g.17572::m.17572
MTWHCEGSDCRTCSQWAEAESSPVFLQRGHVSRRKGCESCTPCAAYNTEACAGSECYSCGSRIAWLVGTGKSLTGSAGYRGERVSVHVRLVRSDTTGHRAVPCLSHPLRRGGMPKLQRVALASVGVRAVPAAGQGLSPGRVRGMRTVPCVPHRGMQRERRVLLLRESH